MDAPARLLDSRRGAGGEVEDADGGLAHGAHQAPAEAGEESADTLASEAVVGLGDDRGEAAEHPESEALETCRNETSVKIAALKLNYVKGNSLAAVSPPRFEHKPAILKVVGSSPAKCRGLLIIFLCKLAVF